VGFVVRRLLGGVIFALLLAGCGGGVTNSSADVQSETAYCSTTSSPSNPITVTALAQYYYRQTSVTGGLTGDPIARGIAYAEVVVTDSSGSVIQCSQTDASGNISFQISKTAGSYTIQVNSRGYNSYLKASVLMDPTSNSVYSISNSFSLTGSESGTKSAGTFSAYARTWQSANMEGGAFNILYNIYRANQYIRDQVDPTFVAEKVTAYWKQGFNPGSYVGVSSGLSFYMQGQRELYILGGSDGNTKTADTDHFDDSVITHEYGHFLEDVYGKTSSPGGSHDGNFIIDPRLAWSEGWANFIQGAVITTETDATRGKYYIDTVGYSNDSTETGESGGIAIKFDLTQPGATATYDAVSQSGEGVFRELSVSRTLYKVITTTTVPFSSIWTAFSSATQGMRSAANVVSNSGIFNMFLDTLVTAGASAGWDSVLSDEKQNKTTKDYADPVTSSATCANFPKSLSPVADSDYVISSSPFVTEPRSNKLRSNDFYLFYYSGGGGTLSLNYTQASGQNIDLDLYIYSYSYNYLEEYYEAQGQSSSGLIMKSARLNPAIETGTEAVSLSSLSAGYYIINVKANTLNKTTAQLNGTAQYTLSLQGSYLCPSN
jgi:hypothetical protein